MAIEDTKEENLSNSKEERGEGIKLIPIKKQKKELSLDELREQENLTANLLSAEQKRLEKLKKKKQTKEVKNQIKKTEEYIDILEAEKANLTEDIINLEKRTPISSVNIDPMKEQLSQLEKEKQDTFDELRLTPIEEKTKKNLSSEGLKEEENIVRKQLLEATKDKVYDRDSVSSIDSDIALGNDSYENIEKKIKDLEEGLKNLKEVDKDIEVGVLSEEINRMKNKLNGLKNRLNELNRRSVDSDKTLTNASFDTLSKRSKIMSKIRSIIPKSIKESKKTISDAKRSLNNIKTNITERSKESKKAAKQREKRTNKDKEITK